MLQFESNEKSLQNYEGDENWILSALIYIICKTSKSRVLLLKAFKNVHGWVNKNSQ